jgi:two-component system OmpR family response regulator
MHGSSLRRVLVVQSDRSDATKCRAALKRAGFEARSSESVEGALKRLAEESFDALVIDLDAASIDGLSIMSAVRSYPATSMLPMLALTECSDDVIGELAQGRGCSRLLVGPVDFDNVASALETLTATHRSAAA